MKPPRAERRFANYVTELKLLIMERRTDLIGSPEIFASEERIEDVRKLHNRKRIADLTVCLFNASHSLTIGDFVQITYENIPHVFHYTYTVIQRIFYINALIIFC